MTDSPPAPRDPAARVEAALARIEACVARAGPSDARYERLRARTRAALADLDAVIARSGAR